MGLTAVFTAVSVRVWASLEGHDRRRRIAQKIGHATDGVTVELNRAAETLKVAKNQDSAPGTEIPIRPDPPLRRVSGESTAVRTSTRLVVSRHDLEITNDA